MGLLHTLKKIAMGEPLDWHLPHTISPDECTVKCARCSGVFVVLKTERRSMWYCVGCR